MTVHTALPPASETRFVLTIACQDRPGLVLAVSQFIAGFGGNIAEHQQFEDHLTGRLTMRTEFEASSVFVAQLRSAFDPLARAHGMKWTLAETSRQCRTLVMVSKFDHCLNDLLDGNSRGALNVQIAAVVSNHPDLAGRAQHYDVPFHHIPVTPSTKPEAERRLLGLIADLDIDLVILARYMQVLSDAICSALAGRVINIHHSFLPSFKGAKPYHQAYARGVKQIGATAHYVTTDLDEGPIIEQGVARVSHRLSPEQMVETGRDVEARVLRRAVGWHAESRLVVDGPRVIVFE